jgi:hypothetical protein
MEMKEILAHKSELSGVNLIFVTFSVNCQPRVD